MEKVRVGGHEYSDPDVISLIRTTGVLVDPRSSVVHQARKLIALYREFAGRANAALERITMLASLAGLEVAPMDVRNRPSGRMAAVLIPTGNFIRSEGFHWQDCVFHRSRNCAHILSQHLTGRSVSGLMRFRLERSKSVGKAMRLGGVGTGYAAGGVSSGSSKRFSPTGCTSPLRDFWKLL